MSQNSKEQEVDEELWYICPICFRAFQQINTVFIHSKKDHKMVKSTNALIFAPEDLLPSIRIERCSSMFEIRQQKSCDRTSTNLSVKIEGYTIPHTAETEVTEISCCSNLDDSSELELRNSPTYDDFVMDEDDYDLSPSSPIENELPLEEDPQLTLPNKIRFRKKQTDGTKLALKPKTFPSTSSVSKAKGKLSEYKVANKKARRKRQKMHILEILNTKPEDSTDQPADVNPEQIENIRNENKRSLRLRVPRTLITGAYQSDADDFNEPYSEHSDYDSDISNPEEHTVKKRRRKCRLKNPAVTKIKRPRPGRPRKLAVEVEKIIRPTGRPRIYPQIVYTLNYNESLCSTCKKPQNIANPHLHIQHKSAHKLKLYSCQHCERRFAYARKRNMHIQRFHQEQLTEEELNEWQSSEVHKYKYECKICTCKYATWISFKRHQLTYHTAEKLGSLNNVPQVMQVPVIVVQSPDHETDLMDSIKVEEAEQQCVIRPEPEIKLEVNETVLPEVVEDIPVKSSDIFPADAFEAEPNFKLPESNIFKCQLCSKSYATQSSLNIHIQNTHLAKPVRCKSCNQDFLGNHALTRHESIAHNSDRFLCSICGVAFRAAKYLKLHMFNHTHYKRFACDSEGCGRKYNSKHRLNVHKHKRHSLVVRDRHLCPICGKSFRLREYVMQHLKYVHVAQKVHQCPHCSASFKVPYCLKKHMVIHRDERPFKCIEMGCDKTFRYNYVLKRHVKLVHKKQQALKDDGKAVVDFDISVLIPNDILVSVSTSVMQNL